MATKRLSLDDKTDLRYDRAWNRGNYSEAYDGQTCASAAIVHGHAVIPLELAGPFGVNVPADVLAGIRATWAAGFVLGYYSSYERHEISGGDMDLFDAALCFATFHNLDPNRDDTEKAELVAAANSGMNYQYAVGMLCQMMDAADAAFEEESWKA